MTGNSGKASSMFKIVLSEFLSRAKPESSGFRFKFMYLEFQMHRLDQSATDAVCFVTYSYEIDVKGVYGEGGGYIINSRCISFPPDNKGLIALFKEEPPKSLFLTYNFYTILDLLQEETLASDSSFSLIKSIKKNSSYFYKSGCSANRCLSERDLTPVF